MLELFIAPDGQNHWTGRLPEPDADAIDGPLATLAGARDRIRQLKRDARIRWPVTVHIRGGRYPLAEPVVFTPDDSGPITYAAYRDEKPVFDGSSPIENWRTETLPNGVVAWVADLPDVAAGRWNFKSLFVDGARRPRTLYPADGTLPIADVPEINFDAPLFAGTKSFLTRPEDVRDFRNLADIDALISHYWVEERMPLLSWDKDTDTLNSSRRSIFRLTVDHSPKWAEYRLENVFETLASPGQWYLDRPAGRVYYLPRDGETINVTRIAAPRIAQCLILKGDPDAQRHVEHLTFRGLTLHNTDWRASDGMVPDHDTVPDRVLFASDAQAAVGVIGAIDCDAARFCAFEDLTVSAMGGYALNLRQGCDSNRIVGNHLFDLGAGGVKILGANAKAPPHRRCGHNRVTDNHIHDIGEVFKAAIGVIACHAHESTIAHNHIHHTHYTGVSVGWVWGYAESATRDIHIDHNHIHHIGKGLLSDMGGIYTLGVQPGSTIRGNHIHDVITAHYGGWAIYPDEGSSHIIIEDNLCHDTACACFHCHYGRELIVRNNIFAFGGESIIALGRYESHIAFNLTGNIIVADDQPIHYAGYNSKSVEIPIHSDHNLLFDIANDTPFGLGEFKSRGGARHSLQEIRATGLEVHSIVADPRFADLPQRDFTLAPDSPALAMGFRPLDLSTVGPRPVEARD